MNRRTNDALWLTDSTRTAETDTHPIPPHVDVAVIGAGIAGLCTALLCAERGASVAVLDAGPVAGRTTGHSTAKLTALHGLTSARLIRGKGIDVAQSYAAANIAALADLRERVDRLRIDCDLVEASAYTCATTPDGMRGVEEELAGAISAGLPVRFAETSDCPLPLTGAVALDHQAHFNPVKFARGVVLQLRELGGHIFEGTPVTAVDESAHGCQVIGPDVRLACEAAVIATHLPIIDPGFLAGRVRPERSYVVAGPLATGTPATGMYLAHDTGWSLRPATGPDGPVLLVGGEGHSMVDHVEGLDHYAALREFATQQLGVDVHHQWSAFDYATTDGLPLIGRLSSRSRRRFVATGFRKWGMTTGMVAASVISDAIDGRPNPYGEVFDSTRVAASITRDLARNSVKVATRFVGDRILAGTDDPVGVSIGEGRVLRQGLKTVAVARSETGALHTLSAVCTHLGCIVGFNAAEQTWDCPCHGSRYNIDGTVLDGPATTPLQPLTSDPE